MHDYLVEVVLDSVVSQPKQNFKSAVIQVSLDGPPGLSAYQIAVNNGFVGSAQAWLDSLRNELVEDPDDPGTFTFEHIITGGGIAEDPHDAGTYFYDIFGDKFVEDLNDPGTYLFQGGVLIPDVDDIGTFNYTS